MKKFYMTLVAMLCGVAAIAQDNYLYVEPTSVKPGETAMVAICVKNDSPLAGINVKVISELPEGVAFSKKVKECVMNPERWNLTDAYLAAGQDPEDPDDDPEDIYSLQRLKDGTFTYNAGTTGYRNDAGEYVNVAFLGNDGALFSIPVTAAETAAEGPVDVVMQYILISTVADPNEFPVNLAEYLVEPGDDYPHATFTLTVGDGVGINSINAADSNAPIYNVAGQRVSKAQKGVYIQNGKKVAVK